MSSHVRADVSELQFVDPCYPFGTLPMESANESDLISGYWTHDKAFFLPTVWPSLTLNLSLQADSALPGFLAWSLGSGGAGMFPHTWISYEVLLRFHCASHFIHTGSVWHSREEPNMYYSYLPWHSEFLEPVSMLVGRSYSHRRQERWGLRRKLCRVQ